MTHRVITTQAQKFVAYHHLRSLLRPQGRFHKTIRRYTKVRTTAREVRANAHGVVHAPSSRVPATRSLAVRGELYVREDLLVLVRIQKILRLSTKVNRKLRRVRRLDDLHLRVAAHHPGREQITGELALRMARRHIDDQTFQLAPRYTLKLLRNDVVVSPSNELGPHSFHEIQKIFLATLVPLQLSKAQLQLQNGLVAGVYPHGILRGPLAQSMTESRIDQGWRI